MTLEWPRPWMSLAVASTWPETEIKTRRKPWLEKTRQNPMGNLRWRINVPKLRVDSWMNHMDTLISFSTWIFIDFNGYSQIFSLYQKCPPKPVLPSLSFFFIQKKVRFPTLILFLHFPIFLYQMIPIFHNCYPKNKLHPIFIWLTQPVQEIVIFIVC